MNALTQKVAIKRELLRRSAQSRLIDFIYNEDVDLCLQVLHNGWCTMLCNAFTVKKTSTSAKMKGGNQTELYQNNAFEKKVLKAKTLEEMWPQYVKTIWRFNRPHHNVNWKKHFNHPLLKIKT